MSYRVEQKFRLTRHDAHLLRSDLARRGMQPLYPSRRIDSIYFDARGYPMFWESEQGTLPRSKLRIRHYPPSLAGGNLELKTSSIEGRYKRTRPVDAAETQRLLREGITHSRYGVCRPTVVVGYERAYYSLAGIRVTFDSNISYRRHDSEQRVREPEWVVEIKAPNGVPQDFLAQVIRAPQSRFSKYSRACLACLGALRISV